MEVLKKVMPPSSIVLVGLNRSRLVGSLHLLSLVARATCYGSFTVVNRLAPRLR
jgi:hypothetical protein